MTTFRQPASIFDPATEPLFSRVVCGIDGSPASLEAARQAALFAAGGWLKLVSVTWTREDYADIGVVTDSHARVALTEATKAIRALGANPSPALIRAPDPVEVLRSEASRADLAVVGAHGASRPISIICGRVATRLAHTAPGPVLIARRPPGSASLVSRVLLASDGSRGSFVAAELAGRIARRFRANVILLSVGSDPEPGTRRAVAVQSADLLEATGVKPTVVELEGKPGERISEKAQTEQASLVIIGSRGLGGLTALGSVSERVAHSAPCSVLIARPSH